MSGWRHPPSLRAGRLPSPAAVPRRPLPDPSHASHPVNPDPPSPILMIKERLLSIWLAYKRLTELSFPRLLGLAYVILLIMRVAHALHA